MLYDLLPAQISAAMSVARRHSYLSPRNLFVWPVTSLRIRRSALPSRESNKSSPGLALGRGADTSNREANRAPMAARSVRRSAGSGFHTFHHQVCERRSAPYLSPCSLHTCKNYSARGGWTDKTGHGKVAECRGKVTERLWKGRGNVADTLRKRPLGSETAASSLQDSSASVDACLDECSQIRSDHRVAKAAPRLLAAPAKCAATCARAREAAVARNAAATRKGLATRRRPWERPRRCSERRAAHGAAARRWLSLLPTLGQTSNCFLGAPSALPPRAWPRRSCRQSPSGGTNSGSPQAQRPPCHCRSRSHCALWRNCWR